MPRKPREFSLKDFEASLRNISNQHKKTASRLHNAAIQLEGTNHIELAEMATHGEQTLLRLAADIDGQLKKIEQSTLLASPDA